MKRLTAAELYCNSRRPKGVPVRDHRRLYNMQGFNEMLSILEATWRTQ